MLFKLLKILTIFIVYIVLCNCDLNGTNLPTRSKPLWNLTQTDKLKQNLLFNYDRFSRPAEDFNATKVEIGVTLIHAEIDEFKSTFVVNLWVILYWNDNKLKWNPKDYGGLKQVNFDEHEIWNPDIMLYNSALGSTESAPSGTDHVVYNNGTVIWVPSSKFYAFCNLNLKYWPFDIQRCTLKFGSWTHHEYYINLQLSSTPINIEYFIPGEWNIIKTNFSRESKTYPCCKEPYPATEFEFIISRRSTAFKDTIIALAFVVIVLTLLVFWLPPQSGEKVLLNGFTAVIISILLVYFSQKVPIETQMPLIVVFYSKSLYLVGFSMLESICVIWISRSAHNKSVPTRIKQLLSGFLGTLLCLKQHSKKNIQPQKGSADEVNDTQATELQTKSSGNSKTIPECTSNLEYEGDWLLLAKAIDRTAFILYTFVYIILAIFHLF